MSFFAAYNNLNCGWFTPNLLFKLIVITYLIRDGIRFSDRNNNNNNSIKDNKIMSAIKKKLNVENKKNYCKKVIFIYNC